MLLFFKTPPKLSTKIIANTSNFILVNTFNSLETFLASPSNKFTNNIRLQKAYYRNNFIDSLIKLSEIIAFNKVSKKISYSHYEKFFNEDLLISSRYYLNAQSSGLTYVYVHGLEGISSPILFHMDCMQKAIDDKANLLIFNYLPYSLMTNNVSFFSFNNVLGILLMSKFLNAQVKNPDDLNDKFMTVFIEFLQDLNRQPQFKKLELNFFMNSYGGHLGQKIIRNKLIGPYVSYLELYCPFFINLDFKKLYNPLYPQTVTIVVGGKDSILKDAKFISLFLGNTKAKIYQDYKTGYLTEINLLINNNFSVMLYFINNLNHSKVVELFYQSNKNGNNLQKISKEKLFLN